MHRRAGDSLGAERARVDRHEPLFAVCVTILVALLVAAAALLTK